MKIYAYYFDNGKVEMRFQKMYKAEIKKYEKDNNCKLTKVDTK